MSSQRSPRRFTRFMSLAFVAFMATMMIGCTSNISYRITSASGGRITKGQFLAIAPGEGIQAFELPFAYEMYCRTYEVVAISEVGDTMFVDMDDTSGPDDVVFVTALPVNLDGLTVEEYSAKSDMFEADFNKLRQDVRAMAQNAKPFDAQISAQGTAPGAAGVYGSVTGYGENRTMSIEWRGVGTAGTFNTSFYQNFPSVGEFVAKLNERAASSSVNLNMQLNISEASPKLDITYGKMDGYPVADLSAGILRGPFIDTDNSRYLFGATETVVGKKLTFNNDAGVIFSSRRNGINNAEIYAMSGDGSGVVRLTNSVGDDVNPTVLPMCDSCLFSEASANPTGLIDDLLEALEIEERIIFSSNRFGNFELFSMRGDGSDVRRLTHTAGDDRNPVASPDGQYIAFESNRFGNFELFVMKRDGSDVRRITHTAGDDLTPAFNSDGSRIAFASNRFGNFEIFTADADGNNVSRVTFTVGQDRNPIFSSDDSQIAFDSDRFGTTNTEVFMVNADGSSTAKRMTNVKGHDRATGMYTKEAGNSRLIFASTRFGNGEIFSINANGTGGTTRLTNVLGDDFDVAVMRRGECPTRD